MIYFSWYKQECYKNSPYNERLDQLFEGKQRFVSQSMMINRHNAKKVARFFPMVTHISFLFEAISCQRGVQSAQNKSKKRPKNLLEPYQTTEIAIHVA